MTDAAFLKRAGFSHITPVAVDPFMLTFACTRDKTAQRVHVLIAQGDSAVHVRWLADHRKLLGMRAHAHVVAVVDVGTVPEGLGYVVTQAVEATAAQGLARGRFSVFDALSMVRDAARGLDAAHGAGVRHKDITPKHLCVAADGATRLGGFGVQNIIDGTSLHGTPAVMAPELARGGVHDVRSDLYALGATLFWLLTGQPLFIGSATDVLAAQQKKPVPSIAQLVPEAGIAVIDILYRLLQKEPARRPPSAADTALLFEQAMARLRRDSAAPAAAATVAPARPTAPTVAAAPDSPPRGPFDAAPSDDSPYQAQPTGVMGSLKQMSVVEILQTLELGKKSARVEVHAQQTRGVFFVHDGNIVHATQGARVGEPAVAALCKMTDGYFRIHYEKEPCEQNIFKPTQFVLLDAMRQLDEVHAHTAGEAEHAARADALGDTPMDATQELSAAPPPLPTRAARRPPPRISAVEVDAFARHTTEVLTYQTVHDATLPRVISTAWRHRLAAACSRFADAARDLLGFVHPRLSLLTNAQLAVVGGVLLLGLLCVLSAWSSRASTSLSTGDARAALKRGDTAFVIMHYEHEPITAAQALLLGHAYWQGGSPDGSTTPYARAFWGGKNDTTAVLHLLAQLDGAATADTLNTLVICPDAGLNERLSLLAVDHRASVRDNAVALLVERNALGDIPIEDTARLDLMGAASCDLRRLALVTLRAGGRSSVTLASVDVAGHDVENDCMTPDLASSYQAIEARLNAHGG